MAADYTDAVVEAELRAEEDARHARATGRAWLEQRLEDALRAYNATRPGDLGRGDAMVRVAVARRDLELADLHPELLERLEPPC